MSHIIVSYSVCRKNVLTAVLSWQLACDAFLNIGWPTCSGQLRATLHSHPVSVEVLCGAKDTKIVSPIDCLEEDPSTTKAIFFQCYNSTRNVCS